MGRGKKTTEAVVNSTVQRHRLTQRLRPNHRATECSPPPHSPLYYCTKDLLIAVAFTEYSMSTYQEKIIKKDKKVRTIPLLPMPKAYLKKEQASEPDMAGMLELSRPRI